MKISIKSGAVALLAILAISSIALHSRAACNPPTGVEGLVLSVSGPDKLCVNSRDTYTLNGMGSMGGSFTWIFGSEFQIVAMTSHSSYIILKGITSKASVNVKCTFAPSNAGWTGTCSANKDVNIFKVESISGVGNIYCTHADCDETVTAVLTGNIALPSEFSITWAGDATFPETTEGLTATAKFSSYEGKNKKIYAKIGTQTVVCFSSPYTVVDHSPVTPVITSVTYTPEGSCDLEPNWYGGFCINQEGSIGITAYFKHPEHAWGVKVTQASWSYAISTDDLGTSEPSVALATTEEKYEKMRLDLVAHGDETEVGGAVEWMIMKAVVDHEKVHFADWSSGLSGDNGNDFYFAEFGQTLESITTPYVADTCEYFGQAEEIIKDLEAYTSAKRHYKSSSWEWYDDPAIDHPACDYRTYLAEEVELQKMIDELDEHAETEGWIP